ncbi:hypothetical protein [Phycicoccus sonneratiae]|uniref:Uncharacterized protein n=1 Tax=Phycicoccus sonneratiae TaxID=2807628 RepID=A0ABS2CM49_9MICO|nr:hypothetical protein [Phycicoccus sonneraticus]MBM6400947.1 hypothetical protein [Phycicoccus sonneraticus]
MDIEPSERARQDAAHAQAAEDEERTGKAARQWRAEAEDIAAIHRDAVERAEEMGDEVEASIPVPDPGHDPGVVQERSLGEAREAQTGRHHAENG